MAFVYCLLDEKKNHALVKIGYSANLFKRFISYDTHNAQLEFLGACECYHKTAHGLEIEFQTELEKLGYTRMRGSLMKAETEWFQVAYDDELYARLKAEGIKTFKTAKNRKVYNPFKK